MIEQYKVINQKEFENDLKLMENQRKIEIFFDIETYQYNEERGAEKPTDYKNCIYILAIGYFIDDLLKIATFNNFATMIDIIGYVYKDLKNKPIIELIAHNGNKYDNHYLRNDLLYYYKMEFGNCYIPKATDKGNENSLMLKSISEKQKQKGIILEKRVKSRINLELIFFYKGVKFFTTDNYLKTSNSIDGLGKKLLRLGVITDDELKQDYDYILYNKPYDMTEEQARSYANEIYKSLTDDQLQYVYNDIIILALSRKYYSDIYKGFDYSKITFTSNILDAYNTNDLTSFQLLKRVGKGKHQIGIDYTDYVFDNQNFYDYIKSFYNGGLNFYNEIYVNKIVYEKSFGIDINSSYPAVMYSNDIPTYLNDYKAFMGQEQLIDVEHLESKPNMYYLYRMNKQTFDEQILNKIKSRVIKQMLVKYYSKNEYININSYTLKIIEDIGKTKIKKISVLSYLGYECVPFGAKSTLEDFYKIKTQGQNEYKLNMNSLYNIYETNEKSEYKYTDEEIEIAKLCLNGLYGIPALRPYFNLFRWEDEYQIVNVENGLANSQRNILFSVFVTSVSLYNLLEPLKYLTNEEVDNCFLYCDTDSLYLMQEVRDKIPKEMFDPNNIGFWDVQNDELDKFFVLNHKKYAYEENGKITVKSGGVPKDSFDLNMSFENFIKTQFSHGVDLKNVKSIYNNGGNISIYDSITKLEKGLPYKNQTFDLFFDFKKSYIMEHVREELSDGEDDGIYIESNIGSFSITEAYPVIHDSEKTVGLDFYMMKEKFIRNIIE